MTDTWAAKVLEGVPRFDFDTVDGLSVHLAGGEWARFDDALAAIARMGAGDGLVASIAAITCPEAEAMSDGARLTALIHYADKAAAHIAALTERNDWLAKVAHTAAEKGMKAEAERDALRAKVARLEGARDAMETCGKCMGSGYGGHPDSGAMCSDCNGSGAIPAADARAEALLKRAAQMAYEVWDDPEALAKAILALITEKQQ